MGHQNRYQNFKLLDHLRQRGPQPPEIGVLPIRSVNFQDGRGILHGRVLLDRITMIENTDHVWDLFRWDDLEEVAISDRPGITLRGFIQRSQAAGRMPVTGSGE